MHHVLRFTNGINSVYHKHDLALITAEIYNYILYDGRTHMPPGSLEPRRNCTITVGA